MHDMIISLISSPPSPRPAGDGGIKRQEAVKTEVCCEMASVGMKEFYEAAAVGLQPELKFILSDYLDYNGETCLEYDGKRYRIARTYRAGRKLEIVCYREVN